MNWRFFTLFAALIPLGLALPASATQMRPLTISQLTARADRIVHGAVTSKTTRRNADGRIYTAIEIAVIDSWKGPHAGGAFVVVQGGGVLGEQAVIAEGQESYDVGEEVVVFARLNQRGQAVTVGLAQGKFKVAKSKRSGRATASNPFHGKADDLELDKLKQFVQGGAR